MNARPRLSLIAPAATYVGFSAITLVFALREGFLPVTIALVGSSLVYMVGLITGEADVIYLAWLDQGSNLLLIEVQSSVASVVSVMLTVVGILLLADFAHVVEVFGRYGTGGMDRLLRNQFGRLALVGVVSCAFAIAGVALSPVFSASSGQVLLVAVLSVCALLTVAIAGTADR